MKKIIFSLVSLALIFGLVGIVSAAESWNLQGTYTIDFVCTSGCSGTYTHTMNIISMDLETGNFSGVGNFHTGTPTWIVSGNVDGSNVSFLVDYDSSSYYVNVTGTIKFDGTMSGTATSSSNQKFTWSTTSGATVFNRHAEITFPTEGQTVSGSVSFDAVLTDDDTNDSVQWAIREGTCAAGVGTVFGNVDGFNDSYTWINNVFHAQADTSSWVPGNYCFVFNPSEDSGEANIRLTRNFVLVDAIAPTKADVLIESGVPGKGLENAPGLQKPFNPKSQAGKHAGKK